MALKCLQGLGLRRRRRTAPPLPPLGLIGRIVGRLNEDSRSAVCPRSLSADYYRNIAAASAFDCRMIINIMSGADRRPER